jgi:hypothetical protein
VLELPHAEDGQERVSRKRGGAPSIRGGTTWRRSFERGVGVVLQSFNPGTYSNAKPSSSTVAGGYA